ncbi:MAG: glycerate kinase [Clostridia bacterium]|nr:glycerate kinase [Clostridia bacterium]
MRVAIAIDSFKGSLTTFEAGKAAADGIRRVYPDAEIDICPLADGGEGTVSAIVGALDGKFQRITASDPLGRPIECEYGIVKDGSVAVIEMSAAAGLPLLSIGERDPMRTTTFGVGEMIADAISLGCRRFIIGIGGSATNDGGIGMLSALGFEFVDKNGEKVSPSAEGIESLHAVSAVNAIKELGECEFMIACDVKNPLCGENGCSAVFAPQKGADESAVKKLDLLMHKYAEVTRSLIPDADADMPGAGAAGGLGFAFASYLGGRLCSGIELVIKETDMEKKLAMADITVTGEGRLDGQTGMGKAPMGVARAAKKHGGMVIALAGSVRDDARAVNTGDGIDAFFPIVPSPCSLEWAMEPANAALNLANTAEQAFRLIRASQQLKL